MKNKNVFAFLKALAEAPKAKKEANDAEDSVSFLCVSIQKKRYYIPVESISNVVPYTDIQPVGHTVSWFDGIIKIQGNIYAVVNIAEFIGQPGASRNASLVVALSQGKENIAIAVDDALNLLTIKKNEKREEKAFLDLYQSSGKTIKAVSVIRLFHSPKFKQISIL